MVVGVVAVADVVFGVVVIVVLVIAVPVHVIVAVLGAARHNPLTFHEVLSLVMIIGYRGWILPPALAATKILAGSERASSAIPTAKICHRVSPNGRYKPFNNMIATSHESLIPK